jgi:hypothetical protein
VTDSLSLGQSPVSVDTADPGVRRLMGLEQRQKERWVREVEEGAPGQPKQHELVHLAGDPDTGMDSTIRLDGGKHEVFAIYKGRHTPHEFPDGLRLTIDIYQLPEEPLQAHLICPKCRHQLRVTADRKEMRYERTSAADGGKLDIAPFQCTWEMPEAGAHTPGILGGGLSLCQWKGVIEHKHGRNLVRDA